MARHTKRKRYTGLFPNDATKEAAKLVAEKKKEIREVAKPTQTMA